MSLHVQFAGTKYVVSAPPTASLRSLVEQVCQQLKTPVDPATCTLKYGKACLLLTDPIRFANLPRGATLVMESNQPSAPRLGFADSTPAPPPSIPASQAQEPLASQQSQRAAQSTTRAADVPAAAPSVGVSSHTALQPAAAPASAAVASSRPSTAEAIAQTGHVSASDEAVRMDVDEVARGAVSEPARGASAHPQELASAHEGNEGAEEGGEMAREASAQGTSAEASTSQPSAPTLGFHAELGVKPAMSAAQLKADAQARKYAVFSLAALAAEMKASGMDEDLPDEFYDLTAADVQHELAAIRRKQQHLEAGLRTKARREMESARKAAAIGHATIRLFLPFGLVVQAEFAPSDRMAQLRAFVQHTVLTPHFSARFHLFTTPPKSVLGAKDDSKTFWELAMVPGANVHVGIEHQDFEGSLAVQQPCQPDVYKAFIRSEVLAREGPVPTEPATGAAKRAAEQDSPARRLAGDEFRTASSTKVAPSGGKVPKWLKLGK